MNSKKLNIICLIMVLVMLISGCSKGGMSEIDEPATQVETQVDWVDLIMDDMTLSDMVYQMMFVTAESITGVSCATRAGETTKNAIGEYPVGGIIYFAKNLQNRQQTIDMISGTQSYSKIPLFIGVDEEGGRVARLGKNKSMGTTLLPAMKTIGNSGDVKKAFEAGVTLGNDLKSLGFNVDFAPVADVLVNEKNSEIGDRAFGREPALVAEMVREITKGIESCGVSAALKHFPGHGSTYQNSHNGYSESTRTYQELKNCEFLPFAAGIEVGADFVMVSHMTLVNATEEKVPSSVSEEVITKFLIEELGFNGIVITDSFNMGAITKMYSQQEAVVKAVNAGADMILMPQDVKKAHDAVTEAVEMGIIPRERIENSVRKILTVKKEKQMLDNL